MNKLEKTVIAAAIALAVSSFTAFAGPGSGPGSGPGAAPQGVEAAGGPQVNIGSSNAQGVLGSDTAYNGSTSLESGRVQADPILGLVPDVHVQFKTGDGNLTDGFTTNTDMFNSPMDGFCGLKCRFECCNRFIGIFIHIKYRVAELTALSKCVNRS